MQYEQHYEKITYHTINKMRFEIIDINFKSYHVHPEIEITQVISGSLHVHTLEEDYDLKEGEIALFSPNLPHSVHTNSIQPCTLLTVQVDPDICAAYAPNIKNLIFETSHVSAVVPESKNKELQSVCFHIGYNYYGQKRGFEFRCMSDFNRLMGEFTAYIPYHFISDEELQSSIQTSQRINRIIQYIRENYTRKITLTDIAQREHLTTSYLSHFFKDNLHQSFQSYVNSLRFEHAVLLLVKTDWKIIDICIESGFSDSKYMNKAFMDVYHMTPREFRKEIQKDPQLLRQKVPSAQEEDEQRFYDMENGLEVLRRSHYFKCDGELLPNSIL